MFGSSYVRVSGFGHVGIKDRASLCLCWFCCWWMVLGKGRRVVWEKRRHSGSHACKGAICMVFEFQSRQVMY